MKKKKSKGVSMFTTIDFGTYSGKIVFACGYSPKELIKEFKKQKCQDWAKGLKTCSIDFDDSCVGFARCLTIQYKGKEVTLYYLILKDPFTFNDEQYITLAHECLHLVQFRLIELMNRDNEIEAEAYLHSYLMQQCIDKIRGYNEL